MIIETNIDVLVFPNWLYGRIQKYTRKRALLDPVLDPDGDRIIGQQFLTDPDYEELRTTIYDSPGPPKEFNPLTEWLTVKKYKYEEVDGI